MWILLNFRFFTNVLFINLTYNFVVSIFYDDLGRTVSRVSILYYLFYNQNLKGSKHLVIKDYFKYFTVQLYFKFM